MAINVTVNGSVYSVPTDGETGWGTRVASLLVALSSGLLQKAGGAFPLSAEVDFGSGFGIASLYVKSKSSNPGTSGFLRLATGDAIAWRNHDNSGNTLLEYYRNATFDYEAPKFSSKELINTDANQYLQNKIFGDADTTPIEATAVYEVRSTTKGSIPNPKMTEAQRDAISSPVTGLSIYNTTSNIVEFWDGTEWIGGIGNYIRKDIPQDITGNPRIALASTVTPSSAGNETLDCEAKSQFIKTGGTATITLGNMSEGQTIRVILLATGSSYTITWAGETFKWLAGQVPVPSPNSGDEDVYTFEKLGNVVRAILAGSFS
jgi:hypothetical protein